MQNNGIIESSSRNTRDSNDRGIGVANQLPLSTVVSDCVKRWFQDALKEAKEGDLNMQVLVSQMYYNGYGVARDAQKGRIWMGRASRVRSSVWKVGEKRPGYNASDSDSDEMKVFTVTLEVFAVLVYKHFLMAYHQAGAAFCVIYNYIISSCAEICDYFPAYRQFFLAYAVFGSGATVNFDVLSLVHVNVILLDSKFLKGKVTSNEVNPVKIIRRHKSVLRDR